MGNIRKTYQASVGSAGVGSAEVVYQPVVVSGWDGIPATFDPATKGANITLSNGDLTATSGGGGTHNLVYATKSHSTGKKYYEIVTIEHMFGGHICGIAQAGETLTSFLGAGAGAWGFQTTNAVTWTGNVSTPYGGAYSPVNGDIISVLVDFDAGTISFWTNGTDRGAAYSGVSFGTVFPAISLSWSDSVTAVFDPANWTYTPPAGYEAW